MKEYLVETIVTFVNDEGNEELIGRKRENVSSATPNLDASKISDWLTTLIKTSCPHTELDHDEVNVWCVECGRDLTHLHEQFAREADEDMADNIAKEQLSE